MPKWGRAGAATVLAAWALAGVGCSSKSTYTYVNIDVTIDRDTIPGGRLFLVTTAEMEVRGAETVGLFQLGRNLPENNFMHDLGTVHWTSRAPSGTLEFVVKLFDGNHVVIGEGTSPPVQIMPGKVLRSSLVVVGLEDPADPDAGADGSATPQDASTPDTGTDSAPPMDATSDTTIPVDTAPADTSPTDTSPTDTATADSSTDGGTSDSSADGSPSDGSDDT